jgi:hypothetical protein
MLTTSGRTGDPDTVRRLSAPRSLQVEVDGDAMPCRIQHHGRWRAVTQVRERYRTDDRWWTDAPISREYFDLLLEDGRPITVYLDRLEGQWHAH